MKLAKTRYANYVFAIIYLARQEIQTIRDKNILYFSLFNMKKISNGMFF